MTCVVNGMFTGAFSGCGSAWLERLVWDQEVAGSNPVTPIADTVSDCIYDFRYRDLSQYMRV